jgi:hypothetical protein
MSQPDTNIWVETLVSQRTGQPLVQIAWYDHNNNKQRGIPAGAGGESNSLLLTVDRSPDYNTVPKALFVHGTAVPT